MRSEDVKVGMKVILTENYATLNKGEVYTALKKQFGDSNWWVVDHEGVNSTLAPNCENFEEWSDPTESGCVETPSIGNKPLVKGMCLKPIYDLYNMETRNLLFKKEGYYKIGTGFTLKSETGELVKLQEFGTHLFNILYTMSDFLEGRVIIEDCLREQFGGGRIVDKLLKDYNVTDKEAPLKSKYYVIKGDGELLGFSDLKDVEELNTYSTIHDNQIEHNTCQAVVYLNKKNLEESKSTRDESHNPLGDLIKQTLDNEAEAQEKDYYTRYPEKIVPEKMIRRFPSGAVRSASTGRPRPDWISPLAIEEISKVLVDNANDFGACNYFLGIPEEACLESLMRHVLELQEAILIKKDMEEAKIVARSVGFNIISMLHIMVLKERGLYKEIYDSTETVTVSEAKGSKGYTDK